jgi:hypothetical protein
MKLSITALILTAEFILAVTAQAHIQGYKLDEAKCEAAWAAAGPKDNTISYEQASSYVVDTNIVDMEGDGSISFEEFKTACIDGLMLSPDLPPTKGTGGDKESNTPAPAAAMPTDPVQQQNKQIIEAKGEDPDWKGKICEIEQEDGSAQRGKCEDVCNGKVVTRTSSATSATDGVCAGSQ